MFTSSMMGIFEPVNEWNRLEIKSYANPATISSTGLIREPAVDLDIY